MLTIRVKFESGTEGIMQAHPGEWYDLRAACSVKLRRGDYMRIPLGVAMELPKGYEAHVLPRSSTFERYGILLVNGMGVIDNRYNGNNDWWSFPALAIRETVIHKGDRICQFRLVAIQPDAKFETVEILNNPDRGGFGKSGVK